MSQAILMDFSGGDVADLGDSLASSWNPEIPQATFRDLSADAGVDGGEEAGDGDGEGDGEYEITAGAG